MTMQISKSVLCGKIAEQPLKCSYLFFCSFASPLQDDNTCLSVSRMLFCDLNKNSYRENMYSREAAAMSISVRRSSRPLLWAVFCMSAKYQCNRRDKITYLLVYSISLISCGASAYRTSMTIYLVSSIQLFHMGLCRMHQCCSSNIFSPQSLSSFKFSSQTTK